MARQLDSEEEEELLRKRGRPKTTGEYVGLAKAQERLNAAREWKIQQKERMINLLLMEKAIRGDHDRDKDDWIREGEELDLEDLKRLSTPELTAVMLEQWDAVSVTGRNCKNLEGTMQNALKVAHRVGTAVAMVLAARTRDVPVPCPAPDPAPVSATADGEQERETEGLRKRVASLEKELEEARRGHDRGPVRAAPAPPREPTGPSDPSGSPGDARQPGSPTAERVKGKGRGRRQPPP